MTSTSIDTPATPGPDPTRAEKIDTALACILMMARLHGIAAEEAQLRHEFGHRAFETQTALLAAKHLGLSAKVVRQPAERLHRAPLPAIAIDRSGQHFILAKYDASNADEPKLLVQRPGQPPSVLTLQDFSRRGRVS